MPDPNWTAEYNYGNTPEANGFSRTLYNTPIVTEIISGNPSNRRVEIDSDNGDAVFLTSNIPAFDPTVGATGEVEVSCNGSGDVGFEITMLDMAVGINIWETFIELYHPVGDDGTPGWTEQALGLDNSVLTLVRVVIDGSRNVSLYRNGSLILGPVVAPIISKPFQRFLWWGEGGGTQEFRNKKFYIGGGVIPG